MGSRERGSRERADHNARKDGTGLPKSAPCGSGLAPVARSGQSREGYGRRRWSRLRADCILAPSNTKHFCNPKQAQLPTRKPSSSWNLEYRDHNQRTVYFNFRFAMLTSNIIWVPRFGLSLTVKYTLGDSNTRSFSRSFSLCLPHRRQMYTNSIWADQTKAPWVGPSKSGRRNKTQNEK